MTGVLAARDTDLQKILSDGNLLLSELNARRDAIHSLLINTQVLSAQLPGLITDNQAKIDPLLTQVNSVLSFLQSNQDNLDRGLCAARARSTACSPTSSATDAGSTTTSRTSA